MENRKCELLAPAGGPAQYIAAVENGADAVYLGGKSFNARINADNFDDREIEAAIDYGHLRHVKSYVAMNTLLTDGELPSALSYAEFLYKAGADGLIVQDLGLGYILKQHLPDLPLHLSTQACVYDWRGVEAAGDLGYDRVVAARELSLEEIRGITEKVALRGRSTEMEVFVHGALCMCYSGQCQLSRFIGGRSGNRGECAQPCRLPYTFSEGNDGRSITDGACASASKDILYPLSPKDLCLIGELGQLIDAGAASLKIEGRMKSAEYVAVVTSIYRKYLDMAENGQDYTVSREDLRDLAQIYSRGGFTKGYFYGDPGENLMCSGLSKHQGIPVGTVTGSGTAGAADGNYDHGRKMLVDIRLDEGAELELGDGVEIHGKAVTGNVVTWLENLGGGRLRIGDIKGNVSPGDRVYKLTSKSLMRRAESTFENLNFTAGKWKRKLGIEAVFRCGEGVASSLEITSPLKLIAREDAAAGQIPVNRETTDEEIRKQLCKTGGTPFKFDNITIEKEKPLTIPLAGINALRRKALDMLAERIIAESKRKLPEAAIAAISAIPAVPPEDSCAGQERGEQPPFTEYYFYTYEDFSAADIDEEDGVTKSALIDALDFADHYDEIMEWEQAKNIKVYPYFFPVEKGGSSDEMWTEARLDDLADKCRDRWIYAGNLGQIRPMAERGIAVRGDPALNITNRAALKAYGLLGLEDSWNSMENEEGLRGALPLMVTEHEMEPGILTDRKGEKFTVRPLPRCHRTLILADAEKQQPRDIEQSGAETERKIRIYR